MSRGARGGHTDAASFTTLRLVSGALALAALARSRGKAPPPGRLAWESAAALFAYAILFSLAYCGFPREPACSCSSRPCNSRWSARACARASARARSSGLGHAVSLGGLVLLTRSGPSRPDLPGAALMLGSGAAWGVYSLRGRSTFDPVAANAASFARSVPLAVAASALLGLLASVWLTPAGVLLALASGGLTSGLGYALWYAALRGLSATRAAVVQLAVPPLAASGGVLVLGEGVSLRLVLASVLILGGIALAILGHRR